MYAHACTYFCRRVIITYTHTHTHTHHHHHHYHHHNHMALLIFIYIYLYTIISSPPPSLSRPVYTQWMFSVLRVARFMHTYISYKHTVDGTAAASRTSPAIALYAHTRIYGLLYDYIYIYTYICIEV